MPEPDNDAGFTAELESARKSPNVVRGAPFPPGRRQSDGPERPRRHVPTAPDPTSYGDGVTDPTSTEPEDDHGGA